MTTPTWVAPVNGMPGNLDATNSVAGINQFLTAHDCQEVYEGARIIPADGGTQLTWVNMPNTLDFAQPITMSGTTIGRVQLPLLPYGNGADVHVALWPDNGAGAPNTSGNPLAATLVPAAYINTVAAPFGLENATNPLQTQLDNELSFSGSVQTSPWFAPASGGSTVQNSIIATAGDYMLFLGGFIGAGTPIAYVSSAVASGSTLGQPLPQPPLPEALAFGCAAVVGGVVVFAGGNNSAIVTVPDVWAASFDSNTGEMGAWSSGPALPQAIYHAAATSWNSVMYVIGGVNATPATLSTVYYSTVTNGQVGAWQTANPLPAAVCDPFVAAVDGWLIVMGGRTGTGSSTGLTSVYYAEINTDGSLGNWQTGANLPNGQFAFASGWGVCALPNAVVQLSGHLSAIPSIQIATVTANGITPFWYVSAWANSGDYPMLASANGEGEYQVLTPRTDINIYNGSVLTPMPYVSVPLPASGLTNGATYHIVLRAFAPSSASDGMQLGTLDDGALPAIALQSPRYTGSWTHIPSGYSVPLRVYDASQSGVLRHVWQDPVGGMAQAWGSVFFNAQTMLAGLAEVTMQPNAPLNANPTFATTTSPWTATGGTIARSSAQTHGGFPFSGLLTPTGGTQAFASTELLPVTQTQWGAAQWVLGTGWFYSPTGYSTFSLNLNWFDQGQNYISTTFNPVALSAATWTQVTTYGQVPPTAAYCTLAPTEPGTPTSSNLLYVSDAYLTLTPETVGAFTSAATVNYAAGSFYPPTGVTQLL